MRKHFDLCGAWMQVFLQKQVVLRSLITKDAEAYQVNLYSLSEDSTLLCFTYNSRNYPATDAFALTPMPGQDLTGQLFNLMSYWQRFSLDFWASDLQAEACEHRGTSTVSANAYSLDMLFAYHRVLACLETRPMLTDVEISDVILAHKRLKGFLDEQTTKITQALSNLSNLAAK